jgi:hypothetical protein
MQNLKLETLHLDYHTIELVLEQRYPAHKTELVTKLSQQLS